MRILRSQIWRSAVLHSSALSLFVYHKDLNVYCSEYDVKNIDAYSKSNNKISIITNRKRSVVIYENLKLLTTRIKLIAYRGFIVSQRILSICISFLPVTVLSPFALIFWYSDSFQSFWWKTLLHCIASSGPCLTKFAQWASTRPDIFPSILCKHLTDLQHIVNAHDVTTSINLINNKQWNINLNNNSSVVLLGSGCVGQVFKGTIMYNGEAIPVAVKVIQPQVKASIDCDLDILRLLTSVIELIPGMHVFSLYETVEEFSNIMLKQIDLESEALNLRKFRKNFKKDKNYLLTRLIFNPRKKEECVFPKPLYPFVSSDVLVETYEEGILMSDMLAELNGKQNHKLATIGLRTILKMVFEDNFIHADLHPGNIIVKQLDNSNYQLCMIDAGIVVSLDKEDRKNFLDVFYAIVMNDGRKVGNLFVERSKTGTCVDREGFLTELESIISEVNSTGFNLGQVGIGLMLERLLRACYFHQVKLEPKFSSVLVAIGILEGLGRRLDDQVDILRSAAPFIMTASMEQSSQ